MLVRFIVLLVDSGVICGPSSSANSDWSRLWTSIVSSQTKSSPAIYRLRCLPVCKSSFPFFSSPDCSQLPSILDTLSAPQSADHQPHSTGQRALPEILWCSLIRQQTDKVPPVFSIVIVVGVSTICLDFQSIYFILIEFRFRPNRFLESSGLFTSPHTLFCISASSSWTSWIA